MSKHNNMVNKLLDQHNLDALLVSSISNIIYLTAFSAFTKEEREGFLLLTKTKKYLFTNALYIEATKKAVNDFEIIETSSRNPLSASLKQIFADEKIQKLGFEAYDMHVSEYLSLKKQLEKTTLTSAPFLIEQLRMKKTTDEVAKIEKACNLSDKAFTYILTKIKEGITEVELATEIEFFFKRHNETISFRPIVAFNENASSPHHVSTTKKLTKNSLVLVDFGAKVENYCSDMTRTFFFGKASQKQKNMYNAVHTAQEKAFLYLQKTKSPQAHDADEIARLYIIKEGFPTIPHSLGHGIGIDVHEDPKLTPKSKDILEDGMVFSLEPGIYIPDFGGVRIEDLVVLKNGKPRLLTHAPKTLLEVS